MIDERDQLLGAVDLVVLLEELGYPRGRNGQWPCPSPTHAQTGATPPMSISNVGGRQLCCCHGCDFGGTQVDVLMAHFGIGEAEAFGRLRARAGLSAPTPASAISTRPVSIVRPLRFDDQAITGDEGATMVEHYRQQRGWDPGAVEAFGLFAVKHRGRSWVRHPYREGGTVTWWQDRGLDTRTPRWMAPPGMPRRPYAEDLHAALGGALVPGRGLIIVEGPADVIAMWHLASGANVIGLPGTQGVDRWVPALAGVHALVLTDADQAGDKAAHELARHLDAVGSRTARIRPPEGLDVDAWHRRDGAAGVTQQIIDQAERLDWRTTAALPGAA